MKKNIRNGVFETNSSSTHSFSYSDYDKNRIKDLGIEELEIKDGKIIGYFCELGWDCEDYSGCEQMLGIILTHIVSREYKNLDFKSCCYDATKKEKEDEKKYNVEQILKNKLFLLFKEAIKELTGAELIIDEESLGCGYHTFGYVDHQSNDSMDEIFEGTNKEVKEEMKKALLTGYYKTDNDNH